MPQFSADGRPLPEGTGTLSAEQTIVQLQQQVSSLNAAIQQILANQELLNSTSMASAASIIDKDTERRKKIMIQAYQSRITKYQGQKDGRLLDDFLQTYENYTTAAGFADDEVIGLFGLYLKKSALTWYKFFTDTLLTTVSRNQAGHRWPEVRAAFKREFTPPAYRILQWKKFHELDTRNGLTSFIHQFRRYIMKMPELTKSDIMNTLWGKLDTEAFRYLKCRNITEPYAALDELLEYAALDNDKNKGGHAKH